MHVIGFPLNVRQNVFLVLLIFIVKYLIGRLHMAVV